MANIAKRAVTFAEHLAEHDEHGYSWFQRWGDKKLGVCEVEADGIIGEFYYGDRDCGTMCFDSWREALKDTPYAHALDGANNTYDMEQVFLASGLFERKPMSFTAQPGDLYLYTGNVLDGTGHVAMCISVVPDMLVEASLSETGGISGQPGDQTGQEILKRPFYNWYWDCILHYNGKADTPEQSPEPQPEPSESARKLRVYADGRWLPWSYNGGCDDSSGDDYAGIQGHKIFGVEAIGCGTVKVERADGTEDDGQVKDSPITGVHLSNADYQAHWIGAMPTWGKVEHNDDDDGAGRDRQHPLDMIRLLN